MKKLLVMFIALIIMTSMLIGCSDNNVGKGGGNAVDVDYKVNEEAANYTDSSDMPDWKGKQMDLTMWYANGSYSSKKNNISDNDVVSPEWARVTGVKFADNSFDNNGELVDAKLSKIIAGHEWPDILAGCQGNTLSTLVEEDLLWDLTELIPKYMPNLDSYMKKGDFMKSKREDGKIYEVDLGVPLTYAYPDLPADIVVRTQVPSSNTSAIYVRDDILKQLKPDALTQEELVAKYQTNNGNFTEEEILNASINSKEEFFQFLRDIKALGVKEGNRKVYPTYAFAGSDNWSFLSSLVGGITGSSGINYFTYYDVETEKVEYMFNKPFFKDIVKELTQLVQEDVISQDSLIDNRAAFETKCNSGQYAVLYAEMPDLVSLNKNLQGYQYRKVTLNIPFINEKFVPMVDKLTGGTRYAFMKNKISEEDLPQILRAFDFMLTDVGQKLVEWGPKSAGLFTENENGVRRFTNKEIEDDAVYGKSSEALIKYGLDNKQWPGIPSGLNKWNPIYIYDFVPNMSRLNYFYSTGMYDPQETIQGIAPNVWQFTAHVKGISKGWDARTAFEDALTKVLTATNDEEFEAFYKNFVDTAERNGFTAETLVEVNEYWKNNINKSYMNYLDEYLKKVKR